MKSSLILAGIPGQSVTPEVRDLILKDHVLGFTIFKRNFSDWHGLLALTEELKALARQAGYELWLAVDQEGGRVFRLPPPFTSIPPMRLFGEIYGNRSASALEKLGEIMGSEIALAGFDLDFAPVVDLDLNDSNPIIGDRAFSSDPEIVARLARAFISGLSCAGIAHCLKHFPGHGATIKDSHLELPYDDRPLEELHQLDLLPYKRLIESGDVFGIMTAHVLFPQIDSERPATLSPFFLEKILREQLRYDGLIFSDDLRMNAIRDHWGIKEAAKEFILAGGDVVLICDEPNLSRETQEYLMSEICSDSQLEAKWQSAQQRIVQRKKKVQQWSQKRKSLSDEERKNLFQLHQEILAGLIQKFDSQSSG